MALINHLKNCLNEQFINAKLAGTHELSPRNGYYFIKDVDYREIPKRGKVPIAQVHWNASNSETFTKDLIFQIALSSLNLGQPLDYLNMVNKVIEVNDVTVVTENESNNRIKRINCKLTVIAKKPSFNTLQQLVITSFVGSAETLVEAYRNFEDNLGINLSGAIELEAGSQEVYDEPKEDLI